MKRSFYKHTLGYALLFTGIFTFAQKKYDKSSSSTEISLEEKSLLGYMTAFDFSREDVRKGWWKYARTFGSPLNMRTYYKVTIPSETTDGNVDLEIYTQTTSREEGGTTFFLGLENKTYEKQALAMILDFKKSFYLEQLVEAIAEKQKKANELSNQYLDSILDDKRKELLTNIAQIEAEIQQLMEEIKVIAES